MRNFKKNLTTGRKKLSAMDYALFLVSLRPQTTAMLREKLQRKRYVEDEISAAILRLTELGYLNDDQFAQIFFENLVKYKHFGYYGIKKKLMQKKIGTKEIDKMLKKLSLADEVKIAERVAEAKHTTKEKLVRALQSRGFRSEAIITSLKRAKFAAK